MTVAGWRAEGGEAGARVAGVQGSEVGVEGQGVFVVVPGEGRAAEGSVSVAEARVGPCLLVAGGRCSARW
ncbi:hypothetical protein GCM10007977_101070 [Dactylosporangium sucinum]|uniref:Uncharacterized protein n=1 Tax=Dactylosporangium sucinum TaxID=1424081 RepID=A0A917UCV2_9ACTN|nr:hypothetical protein GCM10007977_101070 [Dactylosporangium sucinum]